MKSRLISTLALAALLGCSPKPQPSQELKEARQQAEDSQFELGVVLGFLAVREILATNGNVTLDQVTMRAFEMRAESERITAAKKEAIEKLK